MTSPMDPVAAGRLKESGRLFTSDLSVDEFVLLHASGLEAVEFVMGTSVFHVGWQRQNIRQSQELGVLSQALYTARHNAMNRMEAEAAAVGADGILGVRLGFHQHGISAEHIEFTAFGTAVRSVAGPSPRRPDGRAFTSDLSVEQYYKLRQSGHVPVSYVLGTCVYHVAQQGFLQTLQQTGQNVEMPQWTQGYYEAREIAMTRLQAEAERDGATGVVGVALSTSEWVWGPHTLEFFVQGTSIRALGERHDIAPTFVMGL